MKRLVFFVMSLLLAANLFGNSIHNNEVIKKNNGFKFMQSSDEMELEKIREEARKRAQEIQEKKKNESSDAAKEENKEVVKEEKKETKETVKKDETKKDNNIGKMNGSFSAINYAGVGLLSVGGVLLLSGTLTFVVSMAYYKYSMEYNAYLKGPYEDYTRYFNNFIGGFIAGLVLMGVGFLFFVISIPLFVYKGKPIALDMRVRDNVEVGLNIKL